MNLVPASYEILAINGADLVVMDIARRTCYQSEQKGQLQAGIRKAIKDHHLTIIEHGSMTVRFICDRGFTHELVRHRMAVYSQMSTRWCNFSKIGMRFIIPPDFTLDEEDLAFLQMVENYYNRCINEKGRIPGQARYFLPNGLLTEIVITANFREWRLILEQRALGTTGKPHASMLELMVPLLREVKQKIPVLFDDLLLPSPLKKEILGGKL